MLENSKNNFEELFEMEAPQHLQSSSLKNAQASVGVVKSVFSVVDLYVSKFFGTMMKMGGAPSMGIGYGMAGKTAEDNDINNKEEEELA